MSAMCRGDVSIINHRWKEGSPYPNVDQRAPHQCVYWDAVMDYSASMAVDVYQEHYIVNPHTGAFFFSSISLVILLLWVLCGRDLHLPGGDVVWQVVEILHRSAQPNHMGSRFFAHFSLDRAQITDAMPT